MAIAALVAGVAVPATAAAQDCDRILDFETDHAGAEIAAGADLSRAYAGWSVELSSPDPEQRMTAVPGPTQRGGQAAGGLAVHVIDFEDPFCVRSIDLLGFTGGQATVVPQCFDGTALPAIRAEDPGAQTYDLLCGVGALRIEFWEADAPAAWDNLCLVRDDFTTADSLCGDMRPIAPPPVPEYRTREDDLEDDDGQEGWADCGDGPAMAWPGLLLLSVGFRRREY